MNNCYNVSGVGVSMEENLRHELVVGNVSFTSTSAYKSHGEMDNTRALASELRSNFNFFVFHKCLLVVHFGCSITLNSTIFS
jgi:hypothetical protein